MNRGQLVTRVGQKLGFDYGNAGTEQTFLQDVANQAVVEILLATHCYHQIGNLALTSGTSEYRLDASILAIDNGKGSTPSGIGEYEVIPLDEMIRRQSSSPLTDGWRKAIAIEGNLLIVNPTPASSETLTFYYVPKPTPMTSDANDPSSSTYGGIPSQYHQAIEYFMLWQGSEFDDKQRAIGPKDYAEIYARLCTNIRTYQRRMRSRNSVPPIPGYPGKRRPRVASRNDVYPKF